MFLKEYWPLRNHCTPCGCFVERYKVAMPYVLSTEKFEGHIKPTLVATQSVKSPATMWTVGVLFVEGAGYFFAITFSRDHPVPWLPETTFLRR
jgi:hypothetical protein